MKALFALAIATLIATPAFATGVEVKTDCGSYGPNEKNLAVSIDDDDFIQVGYLTMGVFFPMKASGCKAFAVKNGLFLCDGKQVGTLGKFESTNDDGGTPRADLNLDRDLMVSITGSCKKSGPGLSINFLEK